MLISGVNLLVFLISLCLGAIYTYLIKRSKLFSTHKINRTQLNKIRFKKRLPLILFNITILSILSFIIITVFSGYFTENKPTLLLFASQFILIIFCDDLWFYSWHRLLHKNKWLLKHIHSIHHRVVEAYPPDFIYVHPLEWSIGTVGIVIAFVIIILVNSNASAFVLYTYTAYRTLRELDIHSNLEPYFFKHIPLLCDTRHHALHHAKARGNYASTFTYLDKLFQTNIKNN